MNRPMLSLAVAALILTPSVASPNCGGDKACSVGAAGTGGEKSEGKAQGFREVIESVRFPGRVITNSGNADAGHLNITGGGFPGGDLTGTFRPNPQPTARGHGTGIFGDWSGQCAEELLFDGC